MNNPFSSKLSISKIGLGTWAIGGQGWGNVDDRAAVKTIHRAIDNGITLIDTAPVYGNGHAETLIGDALRGNRDKAILSTKCGLLFNERYRKSLSPIDIRKEIESSLKRLRTEHIDIYFCHWPDSTTPMEKTMGEMLRLKEQGIIRCIGLSNHSPDLIESALKVGPIEYIQDQFSLLHMNEYTAKAAICEKYGIGFFAYGALGGGVLTGKYSTLPAFSKRDVRSFFYSFYQEPMWNSIQPVIETLKRIASDRNVPPEIIALAWTARHEFVASVPAGAKNPAQLDRNCNAMMFSLSEEEFEQLKTAAYALTINNVDGHL